MPKSPRFVSHIATLRHTAGFTQRALAETVGVTENTIANWEKGSLDWLYKVAVLCELLDCVPIDLTQNFRSLREKQALTQLQLALEIEVTENTVANWEKGNFDWANKAVKLCQALNCQVDDLYDAIPVIKSDKEKAAAQPVKKTTKRSSLEKPQKPMFHWLHRLHGEKS